MKTNQPRAIFVMICVCAFVLVGCDNNPLVQHKPDQLGAEASITTIETITVNGEDLFQIENINGIISVQQAPVSEITVSVCKTARAEFQEQAEALLEVIEYSHSSNGDDIHAVASYPGNDSTQTLSVDLDVCLPLDMNGLIEHVNGTVVVTDFSRDLQVGLVNGRIEANCIPTSGSAIDIILVNGEIELNIPTSTSAILEANVQVGSIDIIGLNLQDAIRTDKSQHGILGDGDGMIILSATSGDIRVTSSGLN